MNFTLSFFKNIADTKPVQKSFSLDQLKDFFSTPEIRTQKDGPLFSGAIFSGTRKKSNVESIGLLCLDFDHNTNLELDIQPWIDTGCIFFLYTTFNHQVEKDETIEDRFRIVIPLANPITPELFAHLWNASAWFCNHKNDSSCKDPSRIFYTPSHRPNQPFLARSYGTELLDAKQFVADVAVEQSRNSNQQSKIKPIEQLTTENGCISEIQAAQNYLSRLNGWRADDYNSWIAVGSNLKILGTNGLELWDSWSQQSPKYAVGVCGKKWATLPEDRYGLAKLGSWANLDSPRVFYRPISTPPKTTTTQKSIESTTANPTANSSIQNPDQPQPNSDWYVPATTILNKQFEPIQWVVDQILPEGLTLLAGPPKSGKSFFALELAAAIATGQDALGALSVIPGNVLFLSLDDPSERRFQTRLRNTLQSNTQSLKLDYSNKLPALPAHYFIKEWLNANPDAKLVVVDILQNIRLPQLKNQGIYETDYQALEELRNLSSEYRIAVLVLHHTRKMKSEDFLEEASGSFGLTGATDAVLVLRRKRGENVAELHATGRDIPESEPFSLIWNDGWRLADESEIVSPQQRRILEAIKKNHIKTYQDICRHTGLDYNGVRAQVSRLKDRNLVRWANSNTPDTQLIVVSAVPTV